MIFRVSEVELKSAVMPGASHLGTANKPPTDNTLEIYTSHVISRGKGDHGVVV